MRNSRDHARYDPARTASAVAAIVLLHAGAISALLAVDPWRAAKKGGAAVDVATWMQSRPINVAADNATQNRKAFAIPRIAPQLIPRAPEAGEASAPVATITAPAADALSPLQAYVWCDALADGKALPEAARPCDKVHWDLQKGPVALRAPTDEEVARAKAFERERLIANAPVLLPCFDGGSVSVVCLMQSAVNGFNFQMGSYAVQSNRPRCDPRIAGPQHCADMMRHR